VPLQIYGSPTEPGLTPRGVTELFKIINRDAGKYTFSVSLYMLELYQVRGLSWRRGCAIKAASPELSGRSDQWAFQPRALWAK
jgi:hypothetical protein